MPTMQTKVFWTVKAHRVGGLTINLFSLVGFKTLVQTLDNHFSYSPSKEIESRLSVFFDS